MAQTYPHEAMSRSSTQSLLSMPDSWHLLLLDELNRFNVLKVFKACRTLRDLVLFQRTCTLRFGLPLNDVDMGTPSPAAAQATLARAGRHSTNTKLVLRSPYAGMLGVDAPHPMLTQEASNLLHGAMAAAGHALNVITSVRLEGLLLDGLVPSWVTVTCPRLSHLDLYWCHITAPPPEPNNNNATPCGQLKKLTLTLSPDTFSEDQMDPSMAPRWVHQLQALTGLTSLELTCETEDDYPGWLLESCAVLGQQLTRLSWAYVPSESIPQLVAWFPCLQELQLWDCVVDDQGVEALLSLQLLRLSCGGFELQKSYTHRPCTWQHLSCWTLDVSAFDRLPLDSVRSMRSLGGRASITVIPSANDLGATARVAAAVARCGRTPTGRVTLSNNGRHASGASLAAALAILSSFKARFVCLADVDVTPELLPAIKQHLPGIQAMQAVFHNCRFTPEAWPLLLPNLSNSTLQMQWASSGAGEPTEAQLVAMCVHACRPIKVMMHLEEDGVEGRVQAGWKERVQAAMAAAGHQHVRFVQ